MVKVFYFLIKFLNGLFNNKYFNLVKMLCREGKIRNMKDGSKLLIVSHYI